VTEPLGTAATPAGAGAPAPTPTHGPGAEAAGSAVEGGAEAAERDVTAALADLDAAGDRPPAEQIPAYTKVHQALQATLARIDDD
jgi:hypothetical protein